MNKLVSILSKKKKNKFILSDNTFEEYPYSQISKFFKAYYTKENSVIERAAQAVFYWPSFSDLIDDKLVEEDAIDDDIPEIRFFRLRKSKKKTTKNKVSKLLRKSKVKGESVSDEPEQNIVPIEVTGEKVKQTGQKKEIIKENSNKSKIIKTKKTVTVIGTNWREWNMNKMNPIKLSDYTKWLNKIDERSNKALKPIEKKIKVKKSSGIKERIKSSINLKDDIVSEPLADLLADQGHNKEAIEMYEKLSLIFPEKSSFFAVKIKALKK